MTRLRQLLASLLSHRHNGESAQALILFTAGLVGFCGFVGMSIDVGHLVFTRTDLQKIADAAALAGAQDLPGSTTNATTSAQTYAGLNGTAATAITFGNSNSTITVTATRHVDYTFLKALGLSGHDVSAKATANALQKTVTGYHMDYVAPFIIWGGNRDKPSAADKGCSLFVCVGHSYSFLDENWMKASGYPGSDWTANNSNNFKGDVNHGAGNEIKQIGDDFQGTSSNGGLGSVVTPPVGSTIVIPIVDKATGNSDNRTFRIAAWAVVTVDSSCNKQTCTGTIVSLGKQPPPGWVSGGSVPPPPDLEYKGTETHLIS